MVRKLEIHYPSPTRDRLVLLGGVLMAVFCARGLAQSPEWIWREHYAFAPRNVKAGWTTEQRRLYFSWFNKAMRDYTGGNSFAKYLVNILLPSKVISDRYQNFTLTRRDREEVSGCITEETNAKVVLVVNPMTQQPQEVLKKDIQSRAVSKISAMPEELLNTLTKEEILDLLAYLEAGGKANAPAFAAMR